MHDYDDDNDYEPGYYDEPKSSGGGRKVVRALVKLVVLLCLMAAAAALMFVVYVWFAWEKTFDVGKPAVSASPDKKVIAHGEYLVHAVAGCAKCHARPADMDKVDAGEVVPLAGGQVIHTRAGEIHVPNITPHATGIGNRTDPELARLLRYNVRHDDRVAYPLMEYQGLGDADLLAVISYLRSTEPVANEVSESEYAFFGKLMFTFSITPVDESDVAQVAPKPSADRAYGEYLAKFVSTCVTCHTQRIALGASYDGKFFAGGQLTPDLDDPDSRGILAPNLTPHDGTGVMTGWTEEQFVARFRTAKDGTESALPPTASRSPRGSMMAWGPYSRMEKRDLRALYRYLSELYPEPQPADDD